ncbi:MAG: TrmH family RNA methyltransferase [Planctomycetia bacterium]|nr:TrmH family RNA methyltransferase [Planctomycetia bacterium]
MDEISENTKDNLNAKREDGKEKYVQIRHKMPIPLSRKNELVVAVPPMHSNVNLSRIMRAAGCCGVRRVISCGNAKVNQKIARETGSDLTLENHRTLSPELLRKWKNQGYRLVGLEQTNDSYWLYEYSFPQKTFLVVGNERLGIDPEILQELEDVVEIPMFGLPNSHNAATATAIAMYEYCRQHMCGKIEQESSEK